MVGVRGIGVVGVHRMGWSWDWSGCCWGWWCPWDWSGPWCGVGGVRGIGVVGVRVGIGVVGVLVVF